MSTSGGMAGAQLQVNQVDALGELTLSQAATSDSNSVGAIPSGLVICTYFRAQKTALRNTIKSQNGSVAAAASTYAAQGIYSVAANGDLTLIGVTANAGSFGGAFANLSLALLVATQINAGSLYAIGELQVATTCASRQGTNFLAGLPINEGPLGSQLAGQAVLPANIPNGTLAANFNNVINYRII